MWGSWLDQIQKKLDDVSGLAEEADGNVQEYDGWEEDNDEEGDEEEQEGKEVQKEDVANGRSKSGHSQVTELQQHQKQEQKNEGNAEGPLPPQPPEPLEAASPIPDSDASECRPVPQNTTPMPARPASLAERTAEENVPAAPAPQSVPVADSVQGTGGGKLASVRTSPLSTISPVELPTAAAITIPAAAAAASAAAVATFALTAVEHSSPLSTKPPPAGTHQDDAGGVVEEGQLLRFQRQLAEEMEVSQLLREENQRLTRSVAVLEKEVGALRHAKKNAADPQKLAAVEREGAELATQLGKERERNKSLQEKKMQLEGRITALEDKIVQYAAKEEEWRQRVETSGAKFHASQEEVQELSAQLDAQGEVVRELQQQLSTAQRSHADLEASYHQELSRHKSEMNHERENISDTLETLRREKESLVASLQRSQTAYERRLQEVEDKLVLANRRADNAETRLTDHERGSLGPLRELRTTMDDMERQKKLLLEEIEYATEECAALRRSRAADSESFAQRLANARNELQAARDEKSAVEQELLHWKGRHAQLQKALDVALERASRAEALSEQLSVAVEEARRRVDNISGSGSSSKKPNNNNNNVTPKPSLHVEEEVAVGVLSPSLDMSGSHTRLALFQVESSETSADVCRGGRGRVERELVRQAVEIERLRRVETEAAATQQKLATLVAQHDLLMQMYGQLQEELQQQQQQLQQNQRTL
ncbi:hypothetical protein DQ04_08441020 [Trypanosoma grayi]|uniref:hypothetical protein n=1 Tax=Trypanosoma grayi TaxID=71804 RepID=UPI0004F3FDE6|nr:hypothetical protein DQ04_08441020 [Trypanosoma grayi]KEG07932.1 hypothetical protein DQ04_08441020 [Trypanosoma grayi]